MITSISVEISGRIWTWPTVDLWIKSRCVVLSRLNPKNRFSLDLFGEATRFGSSNDGKFASVDLFDALPIQTNTTSFILLSPCSQSIPCVFMSSYALECFAQRSSSLLSGHFDALRPQSSVDEMDGCRFFFSLIIFNNKRHSHLTLFSLKRNDACLIRVRCVLEVGRQNDRSFPLLVDLVSTINEIDSTDVFCLVEQYIRL